MSEATNTITAVRGRLIIFRDVPFFSAAHPGPRRALT